MEVTPLEGIPTYKEGDPRWVVKTEHWPEGDFDVIYRKGAGTMTAEEITEGRKQGKMIPPFVYSAPCDTHTYEVEPGIVCDRDTPVKMRDGVTIYADIYRPADSGPVPLIISWGPFGKNMGEQGGFKAMGVPPQATSNYAKFESADPCYWVPNGYAVANVDPRGVGHSEGYISVWGVQDHYDGYDFIEHIGVFLQPNGGHLAFLGRHHLSLEADIGNLQLLALGHGDGIVAVQIRDNAHGGARNLHTGTDDRLASLIGHLTADRDVLCHQTQRKEKERQHQGRTLAFQ